MTKKIEGTVIGGSLAGVAATLGLAGAAYIMTSDPRTSMLSKHDKIVLPAVPDRPVACGLADCNQAAPR